MIKMTFAKDELKEMITEWLEKRTVDFDYEVVDVLITQDITEPVRATLRPPPPEIPENEIVTEHELERL